jgi:hypothetical protein
MSSDRDIYQILESLDAAQKSVKQLPALFKPAQTSPQLDGAYPGKNATQGYMVGEDRYNHENPMARAVHIRIINQHPEWIVKYGVEELMQAIEDVVGEEDWQEIGSSDVSAYIQMIGDTLRDRKGSREEMNRRRPFAEQDGRDDNEEEIDDDGMTMADRARRDGRGGDDEEAELNRDGEPDHGLFGDDEDEEQDVAEGMDDVVEFEINNEKAYNVVMKRFGSVIDWQGEAMVVPRKYWPAVEQTAHDAGGEAQEYGIEGVSEGKKAATEDILSAVKARLGDYIQDVATAIKKDPDLLDKLPGTADQIRAVKTIRTDDGHEIKIHGTEDDGFRISIRNRDAKTKFDNLDEAVMAVEMYCARRRQQALEADYIEEKKS